jgi:hypothetical protein
MPDDFTHQGESTGAQWVKGGYLLISLFKLYALEDRVNGQTGIIIIDMFSQPYRF